MMDENKLLLAGLEDKYDRFMQYNFMVTSDFLNLQQQSLASGLVRSWQAAGVKAFFCGGYEDAERRMLVFVPDYLEIDDEAGLIDYFCREPEDCPMVLLDMAYQAKSSAGGKVLTHRDYLGSLLGEGIRREKLGDILVREGGAQAVVTREMGDYLQAHYGKAGRVSLNVQVLPIDRIDTGTVRRENVRFTVSSPRLDSIVSGVFRISRGDAQEAISRGMVFVNEAEVTKPDRQLTGGEKLVLRGKGKAIYRGEEGTSKKGKIYVMLEKFL